jgi:mono/diheme cytochrome c family protein
MMFPHPFRAKGGAKKVSLRALPAALLAPTCAAGTAAAAAAGPDPVPPWQVQVAQAQQLQVEQPQPSSSDDAKKTEPDQPPATSAPADSRLIAGGQRLYKDYCQRCHGMNMVSPGGAFFDLRTFPVDQKPRFFNSVTHGKRAMPAWGGTLKSEEIESLWAYVSNRGVMP